jgi:capsid protein
VFEFITKLFGREKMQTQSEPTNYNPYPPQNNYPYQFYSDGSKYPYGLSSGYNSFINLSHYELRQKAREAMFDVPQAKALVGRYADTVVDVGLKVGPQPNFKILNITPERADEWAENVSERFDMWAKDKRCHRRQEFNFYQAQRQYSIFQTRDNDMFTRLYYSKAKNLLNPLQFDFLDPNQIRGNAYTNTYGQSYQDDGIIRVNGVESAYKVWLYENNKYIETIINRFGPKSGRTFMLHGWNPEYAGQGRGYSMIAHALQEFKHLQDFTISQITKAIAQSSLSLYVKPSKDLSASNPFEDISEKWAGTPAEQFGANPIPPENAQNINIVDYNLMPEATIRQPGTVGIFNLNKGEDVKPFESSAPSEKFDEFVNSFCSFLSASMSMPLEVLLMKFGSNYSASRGALVLFWRVALIWREEMNADFNNPIYEAWLSEEIAAGRIQAPGWSSPILRAAWSTTIWHGAPMPNIDPVKESVASKNYLTMSATTPDNVSRNLNGSSAKSNISRNTKLFPGMPKPFWAEKGGQQ